VPVIVNVNVFTCVCDVVETVSVELPGGVNDDGLNEQVLRLGHPLRLKLTELLKPFTGARLTVYVAREPRRTVSLDGVAVMVKSGEPAVTVSVTVVLCWTPPPLPVTVIG